MKKFMKKKFVYYVLRPAVIIVVTSLAFSFIAATTDWKEWPMFHRFLYVACLFLGFIFSEKD